MDPISMLPPSERCVRSKMGLFLRLWVTRHRYEQLRPFGRSSAEALRFHLRQLQAIWARIVACQQALGLDVTRFTPSGHFEAVYIVTAYIQREFESSRNTVLDPGGRWREYTRCLQSLSFELNPYDFADVCGRCARLLDELNGEFQDEQDNVIPMEPNAFDFMRLGRAAVL